MNSPNRNKLKYRFAFRETKDTYDVPQFHSPTHQSSKFSSPSLRNVWSPRSTFSQIHSPENNIIDEIAFQCRRLNPNFTSNSDLSDLNKSAAQALRKAVDLILEHQHKDWGLQITELQENIADLTYKLDEANRRNLYFNESEKKISLREEKLALDEVKINAEKKMIQNERAQIKSVKNHYLQIESELKHLKEELKSEKHQSQAKDIRIHELFNENLEKETVIQEMKNGDFKDINKMGFMQDQIKMESEKLQKKLEFVEQQSKKMVKEQLELENKKKVIKEQFELSLQIKEKIEGEFSSLEANKKELEKFRLDIELEQAKLKTLRKQLECDAANLDLKRKVLDDEKKSVDQERGKSVKVPEIIITTENIEAATRPRPNLSISVTKPNEAESEEFGVEFEKDITMNSALYFPELRQLVNQYTLEINKRKDCYKSRLLVLLEKESIFNAGLSDIQIISLCLERSQGKLPEDTPGYADVTSLIEVINDLLNDISLKQKEFEETHQDLTPNNSEDERDCEINRELLSVMLSEFESKAFELQELEESLSQFKENLSVQTEENSNLAEMLKKERIEFQLEKNQKELEIAEAGKELMALQEKLDKAIEMLNKKEKDILALSPIYECKSPFSDELS